MEDRWQENHDTLVSLSADVKYIRRAIEELRDMQEENSTRIIELLKDVEGLKAKVMVIFGVLIAVIGGLVGLAL